MGQNKKLNFVDQCNISEKNTPSFVTATRSCHRFEQKAFGQQQSWFGCVSYHMPY
jgi:hypothetical protein